MKSSYLPVAAGCWSLCIEKSSESLPGSLGSGRKRIPHTEQAYSPVHMLLPSRFAITALRQIVLAGILKAYTDGMILLLIFQTDLILMLSIRLRLTALYFAGLALVLSTSVNERAYVFSELIITLIGTRVLSDDERKAMLRKLYR